jgi:hypothetical protein
MVKLGLGRRVSAPCPRSSRRGSLQKGKRHQTTGAEDADDGPNHVGPRGIIAILRSRFVSDRHFWAPACCLRSIGRAPLWRLCSIVLRSAGSEPLCDRSAPAPWAQAGRRGGGVPELATLEPGRGEHGLGRVGLSLIASRTEGRKSLRPSVVLGLHARQRTPEAWCGLGHA